MIKTNTKLMPECMNEVYETYGVLCEERED